LLRRVLIPRSYAMEICKPRQIREEATVSKNFHVQ